MPVCTGEQTKGNPKLELPGMTEMVVSLPVEGIAENDEGVTERKTLQDGVYLAGTIAKIRAGFAITSILNTNEKSVEIDAPVLRVAGIEPEPQQNQRETVEKGKAPSVLARC